VVETLSDNQLLDGPWDLTVNDQGDRAQVFVSNVLNGTVTRIDLAIPDGGMPVVESLTRIGSGYKHEPNDAALVLGRTGLAFDARTGVLYVASTDDNAVYAIPDAGRTDDDRGKGRLVYADAAHLHGPLGLVLLPNGDLLAANGDAVNADPNQSNELVEFTPGGRFVGQFQLDSGGPGAAFGIAVSEVNGQVRFAAVDDGTNSLDTWTFESPVPHHHRHHGDGGDEP
jgi:DNA-binding beta-propeller fold protein YncE